MKSKNGKGQGKNTMVSQSEEWGGTCLLLSGLTFLIQRFGPQRIWLIDSGFRINVVDDPWPTMY